MKNLEISYKGRNYFTEKDIKIFYKAVMNIVDRSLLKWRQQLQHVYVVTSEISNLSGELRDFSKNIELLVSNGTVQASRIGNEGGRVFTILARELSRIPIDTKLNVDEVSKVTGFLTEYSTECLNVIRRLSQYLKSLHMIHSRHNKNDSFRIDLLLNNELFLKSINVKNRLEPTERSNIELVVDRYIHNHETLFEFVKKSSSCIQKMLFCIKSLKNTGMMTQYMGLNFASEAVKFDGAEYFKVLSKDITDLMDRFMDKIRNMEDLLESEQKQLNTLANRN